jgi:hypothetical protein
MNDANNMLTLSWNGPDRNENYETVSEYSLASRTFRADCLQTVNQTRYCSAGYMRFAVTERHVTRMRFCAMNSKDGGHIH